ncbi:MULTISPECIES: hybrid sensor histidine kinase/response regulator [Phenylobacterium]|uniref:histidine kinase n=1 Tax=Phenylobacterium koreense TaxID=266125 RepID=A0ABV2EF10_9CAUL
MRRRSEFRLLAPLAALALGAMAAFVASLLIWAHAVDQGVRRREEALVERGVAGSIARIERTIIAKTNWNEAVVNLDNRFDQAWADARLDGYFTLKAGFDQLFVLDRDNRPIYARRRAGDADPAGFSGVLGADSVIAEVRRAEARATSTRGPLQASQIVRQDGRTHLVTATLVRPANGGARLHHRYAPIVLTTMHLDEGTLARLQRRFQLKDLKVEAEAATAGRAGIRLPTTVGGPSLVLSWTPERPGAEIARASIAPIALVLLVFGGLGALMVARIRAAALQLYTSHKAQNDFLANMSHEIRTPLNGVNAVAAALARTPLAPSQAEMVEIIHSSGVALERVLSDVLDLSRIEAGGVKVVNEPFHLGEAVRSVAGLTASRAEDKGLDLILDIDPAAEAAVSGDVVRVKQVLVNLVSNAVKFTSEGYVAIGVRQEEGDWWRIDVQDTGIGFEPGDTERLFRRFQQLDTSSTRRHGGVGLGLSIAQQLVVLMGGKLEAVGSPGEGSTFTVRLPMSAAEATPEPAAGAGPPERPLRILLADDHPTNRKVVQVLFSQFEVDLVSVENGKQALEAFSTQRFDLILMDMQMPVLDGVAAVKAIREREQLRGMTRTPIVMLTANALPEHEALSLAAGADLHMPKPIEAPKLFNVLQTVAERQGLASAA